MKRENNIDLIKVVATIMVVILHVSAILVNRNINQSDFYFSLANMINSFTRVSVPIFVMVSGGFALSNKKNVDIKYFYKKAFIRTIIPTIIWSIVYMIYIKDIRVIPFYHLWYLYMMIGMNLITPYLVRLITKISNKAVFILGILLLIFGMFISISGDLHWTIRFIQYVGYYILGYAIKNIDFRKINIKIYIIIYIINSISIFFVTEVIVKMNIFTNNKLYFYGYLTPFVIIGSIALYCAFLSKEVSINVNRLIKNSFNIYVIHAGVLDFLNKLLYSKDVNINSIMYIPLMVIIVFLVSYISSLIIIKISNIVNHSLIRLKELG